MHSTMARPLSRPSATCNGDRCPVILYDQFSTPAGPFQVAVNEAGAVVATTFGQQFSLRHVPADAQRDAVACRAAREQLLGYFEGERRSFSLPLAAIGTAFQHHVWQALQKIPWGQTRTYGEIATLCGNPQASRAIGRANATNPICVIVPCHRVIGADGSLTGFAFGEPLKRLLLQHEGVALAPPQG
jgi:methylated-DNA-[protein]-cysteine S-methyltransferase